MEKLIDIFLRYGALRLKRFRTNCFNMTCKFHSHHQHLQKQLKQQPDRFHGLNRGTQSSQRTRFQFHGLQSRTTRLRLILESLRPHFGHRSAGYRARATTEVPSERLLQMVMEARMEAVNVLMHVRFFAY